MRYRTAALPTAAMLLFSAPLPAQDPALSVRLQTDEAEAALAILATLRGHGLPSEAQWTALFSSDGYRRLSRREASLGVGFVDSAFRAFLTRDTVVARTEGLKRALADWSRMDMRGAARLARAYLPKGSRLRATVYLLIKPRSNSFVYELDSDPAIMLYLDPEKSRAQLENTVAHELHHVGYAAACTDPSNADPRLALVANWAGAFSEGLAMLAAAGGPRGHPHAASSAAVRARWDSTMKLVPRDLATLDRFFRELLEGRLAGDSATAVGMSFFGEQGPWYTVGYHMMVTIEQAFGRGRILEMLCDPRDFFTAYNAAVDRLGTADLKWSSALVSP